MIGDAPNVAGRLAEVERLDQTARGEALVNLATETAYHEPLRGLDLVARAREHARGDRLRAALDYAEALCRFYLGENGTATELALAAGAAFEAVGDAAGHSNALSLLADACNRAGRLATAADAGVAALEKAQEAGDLEALAWAVCALGNTLLQRGEGRRAAELFTVGRDAFAAIGHAFGEAWMTGNIGEALCSAGDVERGLPAIERCLELVKRHAPATAATAYVMLADAHSAAGRAETALECAVEGAGWARTRGSRDEESLALAAGGAALVALDRLPEAQTFLEAALELGTAADVIGARLRAVRALASLDLAEGRDDQAVARLVEAVELATASGLRREAAGAGRTLAGAHARHGRLEDAYRALHAAVEIEHTPTESEAGLHAAVEDYLARFGARAGITLICASCKSVHDTLADHWRPVEGFLSRTLEVQLSHGLCPTCFSQEMRDFA